MSIVGFLGPQLSSEATLPQGHLNLVEEHMTVANCRTWYRFQIRGGRKSSRPMTQRDGQRQRNVGRLLAHYGKASKMTLP